MNLKEYKREYGLAELDRLARKVNISPGYLRNLAYNDKRRPSLEVAQAICHITDGKISVKDMLNPKVSKKIPIRKRCQPKGPDGYYI